MHYIHARLLLYMYLYVFLVIVYILSVLVSTAFGNVELEVVPLCECPCSNDVVSYMYTCTYIQCIVYMFFAARCFLARGTCYCSIYVHVHTWIKAVLLGLITLSTTHNAPLAGTKDIHVCSCCSC